MANRMHDFKPVFGEAKAELDRPGPQALLPFLYFVHALPSEGLRIQVTDFHANTWQRIFSLLQLEELRDEVGIGGSWNDFLSYLRAAFSSDNVQIVLGGPATSVGGQGATSAKVTTQKSKGMPRISLILEKVTGDISSDTMGNISVELFKAFKQKSEALAAAEEKVSKLITNSSDERDKAEKLQKQLDAFSFGNKKRGRREMSTQLVPASSAHTCDISSSTIDEKAFSQKEHPSDLNESHNVNKAHKGRIRAVPTSRRAKHRGVQLADD